MSDARTEEERLIKLLTETAAALGKILHKRGGHVRIDVRMSGPTKKGKKRG